MKDTMEDSTAAETNRVIKRRLTPLRRAYERLLEAYDAMGKVTIQEASVEDMLKIRDELFRLIGDLEASAGWARLHQIPGNHILQDGRVDIELKPGEMYRFEAKP